MLGKARARGHRAITQGVCNHICGADSSLQPTPLQSLDRDKSVKGVTVLWLSIAIKACSFTEVELDISWPSATDQLVD